MRKVKYILVLAICLLFTSTVTAKEDNLYMEPVQFEATAYCETGNPTKSGVYPLEGRTIAVDPDVIPLGSTVIVYTQDMDMLGIYQAEDIGGAVKGRIIDIYIKSETECWEWGRRPVYVQIIDAKG